MATLLEIGAPAPSLTLPLAPSGTLVLPPDPVGPLVLFFYPQDDTETCTKEALAFSALVREFRKAGVALFGVSPDSVAKHLKFRKKYDLKVQLAADTDLVAADAFGVWQEKTTFGRTYMGIVRTTFLFGADARLAECWTNVRVKGHAETVLEAARALT